MRTVGVLGGMSWTSTARYYELLNTGIAARLGGLHSAKVLLWSADFAQIERLQRDGAWDEAGRVLAEAGAALAGAGAELLVLATNTMHKVAHAVEAGAGIPLVHIAAATAQRAADLGLVCVGLLGTRFTMEQAFFRERLESQGLSVLVPDAAARAQVDRIIFDELCRDVVREDSRAVYRGVIAELVGRGAQAVVLGCTEIGLLVGPGDSPVALLDTTAIHVDAVLDRMLADEDSGRLGRSS